MNINITVFAYWLMLCTLSLLLHLKIPHPPVREITMAGHRATTENKPFLNALVIVMLLQEAVGITAYLAP